MPPNSPHSKDMLLQNQNSFAKRFSDFEWTYLCSYPWFLKGFDQAHQINDFSSLQIKAEIFLVYAQLRQSARVLEHELILCHSTDWYE
jgi:hypothetical protein